MSGVRGVLRGQLQVGAIQTIMDVAGLLARFRRAHPGVTIRLTHGAASDLARAAAGAELGVAFIDGPVDQAKLSRIGLGRDYLVLAVPRGDPLARLAVIRLDDPVLRNRDFVEYRADSALRAQIDTACATRRARPPGRLRGGETSSTSSNRCSTAWASPCCRRWPCRPRAGRAKPC